MFLIVFSFLFQSTLHSNIKPSILKLEYGDMNENTKEILMAVDFNEFVLPYVCNTGKFLFIY